MQKVNSRRCGYYFRVKIQLPVLQDQYIVDTLYLSNKMCAILYSSTVLLVDLQKRQVVQTIILESQRNKRICVLGSGFYIRTDSFLTFQDRLLVWEKRQVLLSTDNLKELYKPMSKSMQQINNQLKEQLKEQPRTGLDCFTIKEDIQGNLKLKLTNNQQFELSDLKRCLSFSLIDNTTAISVTYEEKAWIIWRIKFTRSPNLATSHKLYVSDQRMNVIKIHMDLLLIERGNDIMLLNYKDQNIYKVFSVVPKNIQNKISKDFQHIVGLDSEVEHRLIYYRQMPGLKKIYMSLFRKSGLEKLYRGDELIKNILRIIV